MRLLFVSENPGFIQGSHSKWIQQQTIIKNLERRGIECRRVGTGRYVTKYTVWIPVINTAKKGDFEELLDEFRPDAVILDVPHVLGQIVARRGIPLLVYFSDIWTVQRATMEGGMVFNRWFLAWRAHMMDLCLKSATIILAETDSISDVIRRHYSKSDVVTLPYSSIDTDCWRRDHRGTMALRHPCVGLLQYANLWSKAREMLTLSRVMEALPHVTFYWAGGGRYRDRVLPTLSVHDNFEYLGELEYPGRVMEYLYSIDVYGLASGTEMSPYSLKQAMSAERPAIATDSGGVAETMEDGKTGFLVGPGDHEGWIEKISLLLEDAKMAREMGVQGRRFVRDNWDSDMVAERLVGILEVVV